MQLYCAIVAVHTSALVHISMSRDRRSDLKLDRFLPYVLNTLAERISAGLSTIYAGEYGLTIPEWRVMANLAEHGTLNARQIVQFTTMEKSMVSRARLTVSATGVWWTSVGRRVTAGPRIWHSPLQDTICTAPLCPGCWPGSVTCWVV